MDANFPTYNWESTFCDVKSNEIDVQEIDLVLFE